jgi:type I restriction enzyme, S subunit
MKTPNNWIEIKIVDLCKTISDGNYSSKYPHQSEFKKEGIPFIRANNFKNNTIIQKDLKFISKEKHSILKKGHLKTNDVLITTRGDIGNLAIVPINFNDANINAQIVRLEPDSRLITPKFLLFALKSNYIRSQLVNNTTGTALKQLPVSKLKKVKILLPPLDQQNKIVEILEKAEKLKEKRKKANKLAEDYLNAIFLEKINKKEYPEKKLNDVCLNKGEYGSGASAIKFDKKTRYVRITDIDEFGNLKNTGIVSPSIIENKYFLKKGDILFARTGATVGKTYLHNNDEKYLFAGYLIKFSPNQNIVSPEFLYYFTKLNRYKSWVKSKMKVVAQPNINAKQYGEEILIPLLPIDIQNKFAEEVKKVEKIKENQKQSEKEIDNLFNSLMQKAFKGELIA